MMTISRWNGGAEAEILIGSDWVPEDMPRQCCVTYKPVPKAYPDVDYLTLNGIIIYKNKNHDVFTD